MALGDVDANIARVFTTDAGFLAATIRGQSGLCEDTSKWQIHDDDTDTVAFEVSDDSLQCLLAGTQTIAGAKTFSSAVTMNKGNEINSNFGSTTADELKVGASTADKYMLKVSPNTGNIHMFPDYSLHDSVTTEGKIYIPIKGLKTTDATVTSIYEHTLTDATNYIFTIDVIAYDGNLNVNAYTLKVSAYRASGGAAVLNNVTKVYEHEDDATWNVTADASGNLIRLRATGDAVDTVYWAASIRHISHNGVPA